MSKGVREKKWLGNILRNKNIYLVNSEEVEDKRKWGGYQETVFPHSKEIDVKKLCV